MAEVNAVENTASIVDPGWLIVLFKELQRVSAVRVEVWEEAYIAHGQCRVSTEVLNTRS